MNTRKVVLAGALAAVGIMTLSTIGFATAQTRGGSDGSSMHGAMGMSGQSAMDCDSMGGMGAGGTGQMHEALAGALGITVDELNAQLASGTTVADIAAEKGIDLTTLHATMQEKHGASMDHAGMMSGMMSGHN